MKEFAVYTRDLLATFTSKELAVLYAALVVNQDRHAKEEFVYLETLKNGWQRKLWKVPLEANLRSRAEALVTATRLFAKALRAAARQARHQGEQGSTKPTQPVNP
jgi:hypothetical protein